jgi:hydrogenase maturation protease
MSDRTPLLVLGLGNLLLEDDGVGAAAVALLDTQYAPPEAVRVFDGGTLGLALLPYVEDADAVILVDAVRADAAPGSFVRLDGDEVPPAVAMRLSPHQVGVADLLDGARWLDRYPKRLVLLGLVPESMELAVGLSPRLRRALPDLVDRIVEEARAMGFDFRRRHADETPSVGRRAADAGRTAGLLGR